MAKIKTRDAAKSDKAAGRVVSAGERMKRAYVQGKSQVRSSTNSDQNSPEEYASDQMTQGAESITRESVTQARRQGEQGLRAVTERITRKKSDSSPHRRSPDYAQVIRPKSEGEAGMTARSQPTERAKQWGKEKAVGRFRSHRLFEQSPHTIKTVDRAHRDIKTIDRGKTEIVKASKVSVKTAEHTAKATAKTAEQSAQIAERSTRASAKAAMKSAQTARVIAETTAQRAKAAGKATASAVKNALTASKALTSAIMAGGWIATMILVFICLVGLTAASPFGVFFSGEDSGSGQTMQTAVREINEAFQTQIATIKASTSYDALELSGSRADWKEVLAIYAVKTATDPDSAQEVASMDDSKKAILQSVFWEMTTISSWTETDSSTDTELRDDGHGNMAEVEVTTTYTTLYIFVSHKTADEMAAQLHFTPAQFAQLAELLAEENNGLWNAVLYGINNGDLDIVSVALSQLGNVGGDPYWSWYGFSSHVDWCACFVSWCANECGYIDAGAFPKFAGCSTGAAWFRDRGLWQDNTYEPHPGDIIFFDWDDEDDGQDGSPDHVGIVKKVEGNTVYTIEGNSGDACRESSYPIEHYEIFGYGLPSF